MALNQGFLTDEWLNLRALEGGGEGTCPVLLAFARGASAYPEGAIQAFLSRLPGTYDASAESLRARCLAQRAVTLFAPAALRLANLGGLAADLQRAHARSGLAGAAEVAGLAAGLAHGAAAEAIVQRRSREAAILMIAAACARWAAEAARGASAMQGSYAAAERAAVAAGTAAAYAMRAAAELSLGVDHSMVAEVIESAEAALAIETKAGRGGEGPFGTAVAGLRAAAEIAARRARERREAATPQPQNAVQAGQDELAVGVTPPRPLRCSRPRRLARRVSGALGLAFIGSVFSFWCREADDVE